MEKFTICRWDNGAVIAEIEADTLKEALQKLILTGAKLTRANLAYANLTGADLTRADLTYADLTYAKLTRANLTGADLAYAKLDFIKHDIWAVLLRAQNEVDGLMMALQEGRVEGSIYKGECACLIGTLANVRGCNYDALPGLFPDSGRPAEVWFMGISKEDTPESNQIVKITLDWIKEFQELVK